MAGRFGRVALRALLLPLVVLGVLAMHQTPVPPEPDQHPESGTTSFNQADVSFARNMIPTTSRR